MPIVLEKNGKYYTCSLRSHLHYPSQKWQCYWAAHWPFLFSDYPQLQQINSLLLQGSWNLHSREVSVGGGSRRGSRRREEEENQKSAAAQAHGRPAWSTVGKSSGSVDRSGRPTCTQTVTPRSGGYGDVTATYIRRSEIPSRIYAKHQYKQESEYGRTWHKSIYIPT